MSIRLLSFLSFCAPFERTNLMSKLDERLIYEFVQQAKRQQRRLALVTVSIDLSIHICCIAFAERRHTRQFGEKCCSLPRQLLNWSARGVKCRVSRFSELLQRKTIDFLF